MRLTDSLHLRYDSVSIMWPEFSEVILITTKGLTIFICMHVLYINGRVKLLPLLQQLFSRRSTFSMHSVPPG